MSVRTRIPFQSGVFFITFTCADWLPLFKNLNSYDLVYKWFDVLKQAGHAIHAYVIMPNHLHVLISFKNVGKPINTIVGSGKRFIAYELVKRLQASEAFDVLYQMNLWVNATDKKRNKKHEVFEPSFDWKDCSSIDIAIQKLDYIHMNPCCSKPPLVSDPIQYFHSSANQYMGGNNIIFPVTNIMQMHDFDYR